MLSKFRSLTHSAPFFSRAAFQNSKSRWCAPAYHFAAYKASGVTATKGFTTSTTTFSETAKMVKIDDTFVMNHTCIRIKDPKVSVPFYERNFGMKLLQKFAFDSFTLYMLAIDDGSGANWAAREGVLELTHNHGAEDDPDYSVNNGNGEKFRGFGHICFSVDNIEATQDRLLQGDVKFQKKLTDGRQKNIAFALDPDGYWIELIEHGKDKKDGSTDPASYKLNHSMIRVKDANKSLEFYRKALGMKLFTKKEFEAAKFTLYFLGYDHASTSEEGAIIEGEAPPSKQALQQGLLELTYNWGTESDPNFEGYHNGNSTENGAKQGYGHICVACKDPASFCKAIEEEFGDSADWSVKWNQGKMKNLAFIRDPDGYSIEIIPSDMFGSK
ncbi:lactoylglutathione lyase [Candidozyma haemuli]|uniref:Lactoylglutathione lyase n=1 Tax=Candidozyma haemuli TaxID=45357 RepID=A0A2V1AQT8_9ASCO|nr:lactoylglutathione lyase [[Candida] haemuloni]PVH20155.1 lactoylglutathione lyase [[Candida] haemuloni]